MGLAAVLTAGSLLAAHAGAVESSVAAPTSQAALSFRRPAGAQGCPSLGELAQRVEAHLGRKGLVSAAEASVFIDAAIESLSPHGFRAEITLSDQAEQVLGV